MDCLTAQQLIEAARPDADDLSLPELQPAAAHLRECRVCSGAWQAMQLRDLGIARAMQDVAVPDGLEQRLLSQLGLLEEDGAATSSKSSAPLSHPACGERQPDVAGVRPSGRVASRLGRRGVTAALCLVTASLLVGMGLWTWLSVGPEVSLAELQQAVPQNLTGMPPFDGNFRSQLPSEFRDRSGLRVSPSPRGLSLPERPRDAAALYAFVVQQPGGGRVGGLVLAVPADRVNLGDRTLASSLAAAAEESIGDRAVAVWADESHVYMCFVGREHGSLREVKQALTISVT